MIQSDKPSVSPATAASAETRASEKAEQTVEQADTADTPMSEAERVHLDELLARHSVTETVDRASVIDLIKQLRSPEVRTSEDRDRVVKESRLWKEVSHRDTAMSLLNSLAQMAPIFLNQIHW